MNGADGANAEFVNMCSVFNALAPEKQLLVQKLRGLHVAPVADSSPAPAESADTQRLPVEHPLVRIHPETGKRALYLAKEVVARAPGLRADDSRKLIDQLEAFATQPRFVYAHRWRKSDLLIWDNRCTLHRMSFEPRNDRTLYRIRVKRESPIAG
jgi:alpha-ketoglutarate-dependent taurine dioxygenase